MSEVWGEHSRVCGNEEVNGMFEGREQCVPVLIGGWGLRIEMQAKARKVSDRRVLSALPGSLDFILLVRGSQGLGWNVKGVF